MNRMREVVIAALLAAAQASSAHGQAVKFRLRQGFDNNVFQTAANLLDNRVSTTYTQFTFGYRSPYVGQGTRLLVEPRARLKWYPQTSSGNEFQGSLLVRLRPARLKRSGSKVRASFDIDITAEYERALFLRRGIREDLQIGAIVKNLSLSESPQRANVQVEATFRGRSAGGLNFRIGAFGNVRDYRNSTNPGIPQYNRLDHREIGGVIDIGGNVSPALALEVSGMWRRRENPNRIARTSGGVDVAGENRSLRYIDLGAKAEVGGGPVSNRTDIRFRRRSDAFEGYYSYDQWEVADRLNVEVAHKTYLRLQYSISRRAYDLFAPSGSPTVTTYHYGRLGLNLRVAGGWRLVFGPRFIRSVSNDPVFDYQQVDGFAEIRFAR